MRRNKEEVGRKTGKKDEEEGRKDGGKTEAGKEKG